MIDKNNILSSLGNKKNVVVELGCGQHKHIQEAIGVDILDNENVDIIADVNQGLGFFQDNSIDLIYSSHFLEHVQDLGFVLKEIHRVLKPGGKVTGLVPHFSNPYYYSDYTHITPFGLYSFSYFSKNHYFKRKVPVFYNELDFKINSIKVIFYSPFRFLNIFRKIYTIIFNSSLLLLEWYEAFWCKILPAHEIKFELEKKAKD
ncbi:MAG: methyltransferase domain-containing protein [Bacteroidales bacterium]